MTKNEIFNLGLSQLNSRVDLSKYNHQLQSLKNFFPIPGSAILSTRGKTVEYMINWDNIFIESKADTE